MISEKLQKQFDDIAHILTNIGERIEGNFVCDVSPDNIVINENIEKIHNLKYLSIDKNKICEIGINAGHSLLIMLEQNPTAHYQLFDLGYHKYTQPCIEYIKNQYPTTKIDVVYGDSKQTIKNHIFENRKEIQSYDLIHIDGGHDDLELSSDFYMSSIIGNKDCILIMDDYNFPNIKSFIDFRISGRIIQKYENSNLKVTNKHFIYSHL